MKAIVIMLLMELIVRVLVQCKKEPESINIKDDNFLIALIEQGVDKNGDGIISPEEAGIIISLDVSDNDIADLKGIEASNNLENLDCGTNQLTALNVSYNTALKELWCSDIQLTSLDVSKNTDLRVLACADSQLTSLDVTNNTALTQLYCAGNPLTSLNVSNNTALIILQLHSMPSLDKVCVWTMPFPPAGVEVYTIGSPNVYFTMECNN